MSSLSLYLFLVCTYLRILAYGRKGRGMRAFCHASSTDRPLLPCILLSFPMHANLSYAHHQITAIGTKSQEELRPPSSSRWKKMFFSIFCLGSNALGIRSKIRLL